MRDVSRSVRLLKAQYKFWRSLYSLVQRPAGYLENYTSKVGLMVYVVNFRRLNRGIYAVNIGSATGDEKVKPESKLLTNLNLNACGVFEDSMAECNV